VETERRPEFKGVRKGFAISGHATEFNISGLALSADMKMCGFKRDIGQLAMWRVVFARLRRADSGAAAVDEEGAISLAELARVYRRVEDGLHGETPVSDPGIPDL